MATALMHVLILVAGEAAGGTALERPMQAHIRSGRPRSGRSFVKNISELNEIAETLTSRGVEDARALWRAKAARTQGAERVADRIPCVNHSSITAIRFIDIRCWTALGP